MPYYFCYACESSKCIRYMWEVPQGEPQVVASNDGGESSHLVTYKTKYQNLPHHLRSCLDYISLMYYRPKKKLVRLLVAEGLVHEKPGEILEDTAANMIRELISLGMLEEEEDESCYEFGTQVWFPQPYPPVLQVGKGVFAAKPANLAIRASVKLDDGKNVPLDFETLQIQSLYLFQIGDSIINVETVCRLKCLLVLELDLPLEYLPNQVGDLVNLTYLGLRFLNLKELPRALGNLQKLQTLAIKCCQYQLELPIEVLQIRALSHLKISGWFRYSNNGFRVPKGIERLVNLLTCSHVYAGYGVASELGSLTRLRELGVIRVSDDHVSELLASIMKMESLESLSLQADVTNFQDMQLMFFPELEPFSPPPLLQELHLNGGLFEMPSWIATLVSLTTLSLINSNLSETPTSVLQYLPKLRHLTLQEAYNAKLIGEEFCVAGGFAALEILVIGSKVLLEWTKIVNGAFPRLKYLRFHPCPNLRFLPKNLKNISTLSELGFGEVNQDLLRQLKSEGNYKIKHLSNGTFWEY